jgi:hypothetical protein
MKLYSSLNIAMLCGLGLSLSLCGSMEQIGRSAGKEPMMQKEMKPSMDKYSMQKGMKPSMEKQGMHKEMKPRTDKYMKTNKKSGMQKYGNKHTKPGMGKHAKGDKAKIEKPGMKKAPRKTVGRSRLGGMSGAMTLEDATSEAATEEVPEVTTEEVSVEETPESSEVTVVTD